MIYKKTQKLDKGNGNSIKKTQKNIQEGGLFGYRKYAANEHLATESEKLHILKSMLFGYNKPIKVYTDKTYIINLDEYDFDMIYCYFVIQNNRPFRNKTEFQNLVRQKTQSIELDSDKIIETLNQYHQKLFDNNYDLFDVKITFTFNKKLKDKTLLKLLEKPANETNVRSLIKNIIEHYFYYCRRFFNITNYNAFLGDMQYYYSDKIPFEKILNYYMVKKFKKITFDTSFINNLNGYYLKEHLYKVKTYNDFYDFKINHILAFFKDLFANYKKYIPKEEDLFYDYEIPRIIEQIYLDDLKLNQLEIKQEKILKNINENTQLNNKAYIERYNSYLESIPKNFNYWIQLHKKLRQEKYPLELLNRILILIEKFKSILNFNLNEKIKARKLKISADLKYAENLARERAEQEAQERAAQEAARKAEENSQKQQVKTLIDTLYSNPQFERLPLLKIAQFTKTP